MYPLLYWLIEVFAKLFLSSPRNTTPYLLTSEGHRERVLSLSQALAAEASQWRGMMTGENELGT